MIKPGGNGSDPGENPVLSPSTGSQSATESSEPALTETPSLAETTTLADPPTPGAMAASADALVPEVAIPAEAAARAEAPVPAGAGLADAAPAGIAPAGAAEPARWRRGRLLVSAALAVAGLAAMITGGVTIAQMLTRKPTGSEIEAAGVKELASRWQGLKAGEIFPAEIALEDGWEYELKDSERARPKALLVGIAPPAACGTALDPKAAEAIAAHGCRTVLRATYVDESGTRLATLGIVVLRDADAAAGADADYTARFGVEGKNTHGLRVAAFPGTVAAAFTDARRQEIWLESGFGPYLFLRAAGWADERPKIPGGVRGERFEFAESSMRKLKERFVELDKPCTSRRVEC